MKETLFSKTTLSKKVIGDKKSVESITRENLVSFHKNYYAPNNMIINIASNIPTEIITEKIKNLLGNLPSNKTLNKPDKIVPVQIKGAKEVNVKKEKEQSYLYLGYTIPVIDKKDEAAIAILSSLLSNEIAFRLREQQGLAYSIGCSIQTFGEFGWFQAHIGTRKKNIDQAKAGILEIITNYKSIVFDTNDVKKSINKLRGRMMMRRLPRINQAYYSGFYEFVEGDHEYGKKFIDQLNTVSTDDLQRVAKQYLQTENYTWVVVE